MALTVIGFLSSPRTNVTMVFSMLFGRVSTLTVLYALNSRGALAVIARGPTEANGTSIYVDTTIEPGQLFETATDNWASGSDERRFSSPGMVAWVGGVEAARVGEGLGAPDGASVGLRSKMSGTLDPIAEVESVRSSVVRASVTMSKLPPLETISDATRRSSSIES